MRIKWALMRWFDLSLFTTLATLAIAIATSSVLPRKVVAQTLLFGMTASNQDNQQLQVNIPLPPLAPLALPATLPAPTEDLIAKYLQFRKALWIGQRLILTDDILNFYQPRNNSLIWITDGRLNAMSEGLKAALQSLDRHGLDPSEYWHEMVENSVQAYKTNPTEVAMIRAEILLTDALLRAAKHVSNGKIAPEMIDSDIKIAEKKLTIADTFALGAAVSGDPANLLPTLESLAPQHQFYKLLMTVLADLKNQAKYQKEIGLKDVSVIAPRTLFAPGMSLQVVTQIRRALRERGYNVALDGPVYDSQPLNHVSPVINRDPNPTADQDNGIEEDGSLRSAIMKYQSENGLEVGATISPNSDFWRALNTSLSRRIRLTELNLEKLRWLPRSLEPEYIFVNLAFTELNVYKQDPTTGLDKAELSMKTINGRLRWHSPFMRHQLTYLTLNPSWTAPDSIFVEYELPQIKRSLKFLETKNFVLLRKPRELEKVDPLTIDWSEEPSRIAKQYRLKQEPGPGNALGLFRFGLNNDVDVYMHDTESRELFQHGNRFQSSGCIRIEKPNELAQYLMQSSPEYGLKEGEPWETSRLCQETNYPTFFKKACKNPNPEMINQPPQSSSLPPLIDLQAIDPATGLPIVQSTVQSTVQQPIYETKNIRFPSRKTPPVYTVYITVGRVGDKADGRIRYSLDPYGQDSRVEKLVNQNITQEGF